MPLPKIPTSERGRPHSLRLRLVLWYGMLLAVALALFAALVLVLTTNTIDTNADSDVRAETRVAVLELGHKLSPLPPYWPPGLTLDVINTYSYPGIVVEVVDAGGRIHYRSASSSVAPIAITSTATSAALAGRTTWYTVTATGERARVEVLPINEPMTGVSSTAGESVGGTPTGSGPVIGMLVVAKSLDDVDDIFSQLRTLLLLSGLTILAGALVGGWIIATRVLHPLAEIGATARSIAALARGTRIGGLSQRVRRPRGHDEMAQVVDTFNEMLAALEKATRTQRRFIADASHELRAPLTTIQGNLAFMRRHLDELAVEECSVMLTDAHQETLRLVGLMEDLLLLARADASVEMPAIKPEKDSQVTVRSTDQRPLVELDHAALQLVRQLRRRLIVEGSALELLVGQIEPVRVRGDEESLRRVMLILLDNAIKYTSSNNEAGAGRVTVSLERVGNSAALRVRDTGIGIDAADLPFVFERFYRADQARSREGTGLGLSIAQTLVEQIGGRITTESTSGEGSTFTIWLPLV
ncbi:MAG: HAMP domain-containing sensor histidine kinase [Ktedonobacteraceae bacterium]|nr:HAMP domain-containing histidine kinase [Chloroflexota bacterium]